MDAYREYFPKILVNFLPILVETFENRYPLRGEFLILVYLGTLSGTNLTILFPFKRLLRCGKGYPYDSHIPVMRFALVPPPKYRNIFFEPRDFQRSKKTHWPFFLCTIEVLLENLLRMAFKNIVR